MTAPADATPLDRIDLTHTGGNPVLRGWTNDNRQVTYELTPAETAALVKRLAGYLGHHLRPPGVDRTADSLAAANDHPRHDGRPRDVPATAGPMEVEP